jgi:hypothetical protein
MSTSTVVLVIIAVLIARIAEHLGAISRAPRYSKLEIAIFAGAVLLWMLGIIPS